MTMLGVRYFKDSKASAATEMALITPLLVTLLFGGFEAGYYFWNAHKVVKAVRDGARYAGRQQFAAYNCGGSGTVNEPWATNIKNVTRTGNTAGSGTPMIPNWTNSEVALVVTCSATDGAGNSITTGIFNKQTNVIRVRVAAQTSYRPLFSTLGFDTGGIGLRATSQAVVMGI